MSWTSGGTVPSPNQPGLFNRAIGINTSVNGVIGSTPQVNPFPFSFAVWFQKTWNNSGLIVGLGDNKTGYSGNRDRMLYMNLTGYLYYYVNVGGSGHVLISPKPYYDGGWHQAVVTNSQNGAFLYVDGALVASDSTATPAQSYTGYWHVGCDGIGLGQTSVGNYCMIGSIDEVAIWSRDLSASEVFQLYRRGATRLKYRVRTCADTACSDNLAFMGPDGTNQTYFSEAYNAAGGTVLATPPSLGLATYAPGFVLGSGQPYVQYQMVLESDDTANRCTYNGVAAPCSPENANVTFARTNYDTSLPTLTNVNTVPFNALSSFAGTAGALGCPDGLTFAMSPTGASYYYDAAGLWRASNGTAAQTNSASQLTPSAMNWFGSQFGVGQTYFRAYLNSAGINPCTLKSVVLTGTL